MLKSRALFLKLLQRDVFEGPQIVSKIFGDQSNFVDSYSDSGRIGTKRVLELLESAMKVTKRKCRITVKDRPQDRRLKSTAVAYHVITPNRAVRSILLLLMLL